LLVKREHGCGNTHRQEPKRLLGMIILATRNRHKAQEIGAILGTRCLTLEDVPGAPALVEDADTFAGNATRKAEQLAQWLAAHPPEEMVAALEPASRQPDNPPSRPAAIMVLADDSGLEVDALNGAPGVYSARFAALESGVAGNTTDVENNAKLLRLLREVPLEKRTARFRCVLALIEMGAASPGPARLFEGACEGHIGFAPRGKEGFGYDPLFIPEGQGDSFAELGEDVKNSMSHRARALAQLRAWLG
jgi:XTP/dITP diphosphohydrolase